MTDIKNQSWTRRLYDGCKSTDDLRVTTGPGRYQLDAPPQYCNSAYIVEPTTRLQKWGDAQNDTYIKTDVESDLFNINRPTTKNVCGNYDPKKNVVNNSSSLKPVKEESFPNTFSRLSDPPCTLRGSGWNRWEWLCENPQEGVMMPFDWNITTRLQSKDQFRPCIPKPIDSSALVPAPGPYDSNKTQFDSLTKNSLNEFGASVERTLETFPRGVDVLPALPTALTSHVKASPLNPPSLAMAPREPVNRF